MGRFLFIFAALLVLLLVRSAEADPTHASSGDGSEFFEKKIRPLLVENCFRCHSATS